MRGYRCYYVDAKDHITGVEQVAAEDDGAAIQSARRFLRAKQFVGVGVELWEGKRRVWYGQSSSQPGASGMALSRRSHATCSSERLDMRPCCDTSTVRAKRRSTLRKGLPFAYPFRRDRAETARAPRLIGGLRATMMSTMSTL